jgi:sugar lactone lactonase YvrE
VTDPFLLEVEQGRAISQTLPVATVERLSVSLTGTVSGAPWLTVPAQSATTQTGLKVNVSAAGLAQGTYEATVILRSSQTMADSPLPVRLTVNAAVPPGPTYGAEVVAGGGAGGTAWPSGVQAVGATLTGLDLVTKDSAGRIYIASSTRVMRIEPNGTLTAVAGNGQFTPAGSANGDGGPATSATFSGIEGMAVDGQGRVYLSDSFAHRIRVVENGTIRTEFSSADKVGISSLSRPKGMAFAANGDLYVVTLFALAKVPAGQKRLDLVRAPPGGSVSLSDVAVAADGTVYITETDGHRVYQLPAGTANFVAFAGSGTAGFNGDGVATQVQLNRPTGVGVDAQGNVWVVDDGH